VEPFPLGLTIATASFAVSGVALLLRRLALVSAALITTGGAVGVAAAVLLAAGPDAWGESALVLATGLLLPLGLATYPEARWRHPVDIVALVVLAGCGAVAISWTAAGDLMGLVLASTLIAQTWWRIEVSRDRERRALVWLSLAVTT
jgi:hypothetical protein